MIDLTAESETKSRTSLNSTADEVVVNLTGPGTGPIDYGHGDYGRAISISSDSHQDHESRAPSRLAKRENPHASLPPNPSPAKSARFSSRDELIQPVSPGPSARRENMSNDTPRPSQGDLNVRQGSLVQTPRKSGWTVDKITAALTKFAEAVEQGHSQLVECLLEDTEVDAPPDSRSPDGPDPFGEMSSCALEPGAPLPEGDLHMNLKIKVCLKSGFFLSFNIVLTHFYSNIVANMARPREIKDAELALRSHPSGLTRKPFPSTHFTMLKFERIF